MNKENKMVPLYSEVQRVRQIWIWLIVLLLAGLFWYLFAKQVIMGSPLGSRPAPDVVLAIFWLIFGIGFPLLFFSAKLITEVRNDGVYIKFFPLHWSFHEITFRELKRYEVRTYKPIREYGGWGIRKGRHGDAYNMRGNKGVQLELYNNKRILIGSIHPEELYQAIHTRVSDQKSI